MLWFISDIPDMIYYQQIKTGKFANGLFGALIGKGGIQMGEQLLEFEKLHPETGFACFDTQRRSHMRLSRACFSKNQQGLVFGYKTFQVGSAGEQTLVDIEGRWGISENRGTNPPLGDLTEFFPGAFDIEFEHFTSADKEMPRAGQVSYLVSTPTGATLGQLVCRGQTGVDPTINVCEFIDPTDAAEPLFLFYQDGPSSLSIEYGRALIAVGVAPGGKAVRLD